MNNIQKYGYPSPETDACFLSKVFFCWTVPIFKRGYRNQLKTEDISDPSEEDLSSNLGNKLELCWKEELRRAVDRKRAPSLQKALLNTFGLRYAVIGGSMLIRLVIRLAVPIVLSYFIQFFDERPENASTTRGWLLASSVVLLIIGSNILDHYICFDSLRLGMKARIACCSLIYRKVLKISHNAQEKTAAGQIVNLLSNDVQRFDMASLFLHFIWIMPIQFCAAFYIGYESIGAAIITGMIAVAVLAIPIQGNLSKLEGRYRAKVATKTDHRIKLMSEITTGIKVIKMYAWEKPFEKMVEAARKLEIEKITKTSYIKGIQNSMGVFTDRLALYLTLITYVLHGRKLSGDIVFSLANIFNLVQFYTSFLFPTAVSFYSELNVSIRRIEEFLLLEEYACDGEINYGDDNIQIGSVDVKKVIASWSNLPPVLVDIDFRIQPGMLCCVVGHVGCGKSSLLQLLMKHLPAETGRVDVFGKVSYAAQDPWLFFSSVKNNILFGRAFDAKRYSTVVEACALMEDFEKLPRGDETLVGEKGVSLSGGQRTRINLARAVYADADVYLMDDPLSSVDSHVMRQIFEKCIKNYLAAKTRILVTHQLQFLEQADLIIVMNAGKIIQIGNTQQLNSCMDYLGNQYHTNENIVENDNIEADKNLQNNTEKNHQEHEEEEAVESGIVPLSAYWAYYRSGSNLFLLLLFGMTFIFGQIACNLCDLYLRHWLNEKEYTNDTFSGFDINNTSKEEQNTTLLGATLIRDIVDYDYHHHLAIYTVLVLFAVCFCIIRAILFYKVSMNSSKSLHNSMFSCLLQAPMRFFDTNASGRILTRFSKDIGIIDELIPLSAMNAYNISLQVIGVLALVYIVSPWMILPSLFLGIVFAFLRGIYLPVTQDITRLESVARAPIFSHVSASLKGLLTIRSSNRENRLVEEFDSLQDLHTGTWVLNLAVGEAFGLSLDIISNVFMIMVAFQFLIFRNENSTSANVGLIISQCLTLSGMLPYGVRQTAEFAGSMISVERVLQYTKLANENTVKKEETDGNFVTSGKIVFNNVNLRYSISEPPILNNLNFEINPKEKIGIVGRTGAGKSSIVAALFRLAPTEGVITIDDVDTSTVELKHLRSQISIIPQEPFLFSATIRYNLDPLGTKDDASLWKALENVELKSVIEDLDQDIHEGGMNFSVGQRQLICLARAIIRNNKILVMDEATANVDNNTDMLIQRAIRRNFKECTVLTIAHRLNSIMDSDKVLVMDSGAAIEFDHPHKLLQDCNGKFRKIVEETGNMAEELKKAAENTYNARYGKLKIHG